MSKSRVGIDWSVHKVTWATAAEAEALLTENRVVMPSLSSRFTSKYGSSRVAAGTSSMVQISAIAGVARAARAKRATATQIFRTVHLLWKRSRAPECAPRARWLKRSEEHTSELQSPCNLVCRLLLEKKNTKHHEHTQHHKPSAAHHSNHT